MSEILTILGIVLPLLAGEQILFWKQIKKVKAAEGTNADVSNSLKLVELQEQYINLINGKDEKIRELNNELVKSKEQLIFYKTTHCTNLSCPTRVPPLKNPTEEYDSNKKQSNN